MGPNGSGKSTLLMHFNGLLSPTLGEVKVQGITVERSNLSDIRGRVGLVFQDPDNQLFAPTVWDDIAFGPQNMGLSGGHLHERVDYIINLLHLNELSDRPCQHLSGGQKKKVAIAGVLAMEPEIIVLDEPTTGLDHSNTFEIVEIMDELSNEGKTIIISTHDVNLASTWADDIIVLNSGEIYTSGPPRQVFSDTGLVSRTRMGLPTVVQTYREFEARGIAEGHVPMTLLDLVDSMESPFIGVRCAVADFPILKDQEVGLVMKEGTIVAVADIQQEASGRALYDAAPGDEVLVKDVSGSLTPGTGYIRVIQIPRIIEGGSKNVDIESIKALIIQEQFDRVGAMGTSAKVTAKKAGLHPDFEVDVVQSAMLSALRGLNCLILASGGMAAVVKQRVDERNQNRRRCIRCTVSKV